MDDALLKDPGNRKLHLVRIESSSEDDLRSAMEFYSANFCLTVSEWVEWIERESAADFEYTKLLLEKAIAAHPVASLWLRLLDFVADKQPTGSMDSLLESASITAGSDFEEGWKIWRRLNCVAAAKRELAIPGRQLEQRFAERCQEFPEHSQELSLIYSSTLPKQQKLLPLYDAFSSSGDFSAILAELTNCCPRETPFQQIRSLFERAIAVQPDAPATWVHYLHTMSRLLPDEGAICGIGERMCRSHSRRVSLWLFFLATLEAAGSSSDFILNHALTAIRYQQSCGNAQFFLYQWMFQFAVRRRSIEVLHFASKVAASNSESLKEYRAYVLQAEIQAHRLLGSNEGAKGIWMKELLDGGTSEVASLWLQFLADECRHCGGGSCEVAEISRLYQRAIRLCPNDLSLQQEFACFDSWNATDANREAKKRLLANAFSAASQEKAEQPEVKERKRTIFLSNLSFNCKESDLQRVFQSLNPTALRLVRNKNGSCKGFAYVDFNGQDSVAAALRLDRKPVAGRPMYVSEYDPKRKKSQSADDRLRLFLSSVPSALKQEAVQEVVAKLISVPFAVALLVKNGSPTNAAYLYFSNESDTDASFAQLSGGVRFGDHLCSVKKSQPPSVTQSKP